MATIYLEEHHIGDEIYGHLWICAGCYHLYERGPVAEVGQTCACPQKAETEGVTVRPRQEGEPVHDFPQIAILCRCCGLTALRSGSRWSMLLCRGCAPLARAVSVWERRLIFPIGRHSLMHTFVPNTPSPSLRDYGGDCEAMAKAMHPMFQGLWSGLDGLELWYGQIMRRNFERLKLRDDVRLWDYLEAVEAEMGPYLPRLDAFQGMCEFFQGRGAGQPLPPG